MTFRLTVLMLGSTLVMFPGQAIYAQSSTPPSGDIKALEPPIDQRKKQNLDNTLPPTTASKDTKPVAPNQKDKGTTDAR